MRPFHQLPPFFLAGLCLLSALTARSQVPDSLARLFRYDARLPLGMAVVSRERLDRVTTQTITYLNAAGRPVAALLAAPDGPGKYPAVVYQHWGEGDKEEFRAEAQALAARGFVCLAVDAPWLGPNSPYTSLSAQFPQIVRDGVVTVRRGVDLLLSLPAVDPARVAFVGHSYGAGVGGILTGIEPRLKAFVLMTGVYSFSAMMEDTQGGYWQKLRDSIPETFRQMVAAVRPYDVRNYISFARKPIFQQFARHDELIPLEMFHAYMKGSPPTAVFRFYEAGHALNDNARRDRLDWLAGRMQGPPADSALAALPGYGFTTMPLVVPVPADDRVAVKRNLEYTRRGTRAYRLDCYAPAGKGAVRRPAVILVPGVAHPALLAFAKDWEGYQGWARLLAAEGFIAIAANLGSPAAGPRPEQWYGNVQEPLTNLRELVSYVQRNAADLHVDPSRLAVVAFSGGGNTGLGPALGDLPVPVRCAVGMYPVMDAAALQHTRPALGGELLRVLSPAGQLAARGGSIPPLFLVKAQHDQPELNGSIDAFMAEANRLQAPVVLRQVPDGHHGFDLLDDYAQAHRVIAEALAFLRQHLQP